MNNMSRYQRVNSPDGFVLALVVIIIASLLSIIIVSTALGTITNLEHATVISNGTTHTIGAEGCLNEALVQLAWDENYTGTTFSQGVINCTVTVTGSGSTRGITAIGTQGIYTDGYSVSVHLDPLFITSWKQ